ncbi:hypothetical protein HX867_23425 [Pseudomonas gingeri]|uniref:hypothetical protein n=1 Tax=Pseudomonas gingeri TaxID=117681 RepID=UPI0015A33C44|nr:hypothetical protein [Pseudomonas gingeri]NVZ65063.1 hypothetical protein [Pseudomonas gingeri]NVZ77929.1 hypothetical protein [Pseudomonas gingeri]
MQEDDTSGLTDSQFWSDPDRMTFQTARRLKAEKFSGIRLYAPRQVPIDLRESLPLILFQVASFREAFRMNFQDNALIVMVDIARHQLLVGFVTAPDVLSLPQDIDPTEIPEGTTAQQDTLDLRQHLQLDWKPATYLICIVVRDNVSNRIRVQLTRSPRAYVDPEAERFIAAQKRKLPLPAIWPPLAPRPIADTPASEQLPDYRHRPDSPDLPEGFGVELAMDPVVPMRPGARLMLRASFRMPASAGIVTAQHPTSSPPIVAGQMPTVLMPITLLLTGSERAAPSVWRLIVPSFDPLGEPIDTASVSGYFTFDMLAVEDLRTPLQTYFVYWFCGEAMGGPSRLTLLSQDDIE